jgi:hypothetical protein
MGATVLPLAGDISVAGHDYWILPMSLPRWVGPVGNAPYLKGQASKSGGIGIAWKGTRSKACQEQIMNKITADH